MELFIQPELKSYELNSGKQVTNLPVSSLILAIINKESGFAEHWGICLYSTENKYIATWYFPTEEIRDYEYDKLIKLKNDN
jgi:hypothetical protein